MEEINLSMSEMMSTVEFMNLNNHEKYIVCLLYPGQNISTVNDKIYPNSSEPKPRT